MKDGIEWTEILNRPSGLDDGDQIGITTEDDPQGGLSTTNYIQKWDGIALITRTIYDNGNIGSGTSNLQTELHCELVAHHWEASNSSDRAIEYLVLASE